MMRSTKGGGQETAAGRQEQRSELLARPPVAARRISPSHARWSLAELRGAGAELPTISSAFGELRVYQEEVPPPLPLPLPFAPPPPHCVQAGSEASGRIRGLP